MFKEPYFSGLAIFFLNAPSHRRNGLFEPINRFRFVGKGEFSQLFLIENCLVNVKLPDARTGEINTGTYLITMSDVVLNCQKRRKGDLLTVDN